MASSDIIGAARSLVHGSVKLCGLTRAEDVEISAQAGATHAGFIFVPDTPRAIDLTRSRELAEIARESGLKIVGVFRDAETGELVRAADELQLDAVQLHGIENAAAVRRALPETTEIWALCGVGNSAASARAGADRSLFDTISYGSSGGTGRAFDWSKLDGRDDLPSAFLGGGIGPQNAKAASKVGAYGLDVGSSVEAAPGIKDAAKIEALFVVLRPPARGDA
jgi:indole-3-glycerol phosphate synthase/phosphoribosylanthranilate isomerase